MDALRRALDRVRGASTGQKQTAAAVAAAVAALWALRNRHWLKAQKETWAIQVQSMASRTAWSGGVLEWLHFQFEVWRLLQLDVLRRVEFSRCGLQYGAGVPHVDTGASAKKHKGKMKMDVGPIVKDLVLVGGGHSHAFVLKNFGMNPVDGVRLTLITRDLMTPYSGMVPGYVALAYTKEECHIDLARLGRFARATIIHASATGIDYVNKKVLVEGRPPVSFDVLSINIGSNPRQQSCSFDAATIPITPVKPIDGFSARWEAIYHRVMASASGITLGVVGAGAGGVELTLSMLEALRTGLAHCGKSPRQVSVVLVSRAPTVMPSHNRRVQATFARILKERGVEVVLGVEATGVKAGAIQLSDGRQVAVDEVVWCTQAGTQPWLASTGLRLQNDFVVVKDTFESVNMPCVFAAGDCAVMENHPRPRAGVFAVRAGPPLAANLRHSLLGEPLEDHAPQTHFLGIIGTGAPYLAVASKGPMAMEGPWLWHLKDWIDRKWMASYSTALPDMAAGADVDDADLPAVAHAAGAGAIAALKHATMRCGGCGAKVGATVLSRVMAKLELPPAPDYILTGLDAPDDCAVVAAPPAGKALVHTVDFFRAFTTDPYVFGQIAANHALSDCHAMGADPQTALAVAVVPYAVEAKVEDTLFHMMSGAVKVLSEAGCTLVGGHTCEGAELALGFSVNGVVDTAAAMRKSGMQHDDVVILTKAVGTGTILAADMRVKACAPWVAAAYGSMLQSNAQAAAIAARFGATACTDVTGFGVLGHLVEMATASDVSVTVILDALPTLPGAEECVHKGIFSSLQPDNTRLRRAVSNADTHTAHPKFPLLFDPQTAGGLLFSVPPTRVADALAALHSAGYERAVALARVVKRGDAADSAARITLRTVS